ncbi:unnamed protein product [Cuscuta campestris]|uniref:CCHC-type domain-containing protein n=1 Tax=Cuscuta campestris TaxID=132261 RepID=A0A484MY13_9ASTE|nr:unnamed protein product [Cuscuta campestris]
MQNLRQKGQSVVAYYNQFITLWNQLYRTKDPTFGCKCPAAALIRADVEHEKTHTFLLGLDDEQYGSVRSQILGTEPVPDISRVYALVAREERHRSIVRARDDRTDAMAFAVGRPPPPAQYQCTHCGKTGHTVDRCYQIIGFPAGGRGGRGGGRTGRGGRTGGRGTKGSGGTANEGTASAAAVEVSSAVHSGEATPTSLSSDQVTRLLSMLIPSSSHMSLNGMPQSTSQDWLVDSGASHHMTGTFSYLFDVSPIPPCPVTLPDGSRVLAKTSGSVHVSPTLVLRNVLFVPTLRCNLISVGCLVRANNCLVIFDDRCCVLQDRVSMVEIGRGNASNGVYVFQPSATVSALSVDQATLLHKRLGHPSPNMLSFPPFNKSTKGWRVYDMESRRLFHSRDISFDESVFPFATPSPAVGVSSSPSSHADFPAIVTAPDPPPVPVSPTTTTPQPTSEVESPSLSPQSTPVSSPSSSDDDQPHSSPPQTVPLRTLPPRTRRQPSHLSDYVCHSALTCNSDASSPALSTRSEDGEDRDSGDAVVDDGVGQCWAAVEQEQWWVAMGSAAMGGGGSEQRWLG